MGCFSSSLRAVRSDQAFMPGQTQMAREHEGDGGLVVRKENPGHDGTSFGKCSSDYSMPSARRGVTEL